MNDKQKADAVEAIRRGFFNRNEQDEAMLGLINRMAHPGATQEDAAAYAERLGENLSETLREMYSRRSSFTGWEAVKDEEQIYALAKDLIDPIMKVAHTMVNNAGAQVQKRNDEAIGMGIRSVTGKYKTERLNGLYRQIARAAIADSKRPEIEAPVKQAQLWRGGKPIGSGRLEAGTVESWLGEPVVNNVQAFFDEYVRANAEARFNMGLGPVIVRTAAPGCCAWCAARAGVYHYEEVRQTGSEVFRRHKFCRCTVTYRDEGIRRNVWGRKQWEADQKTLEKRKGYGLDTGKRKPPTPEEFIRQEEEKALAKAAKSGIIKEPDIYIGRSVGAKAKNYRVRLPDGTYTELAENTSITNIQVIAGKGRRRDIDAIETLMAKFPESTEEEWQKKKGFGYVDVDGESFKAELHWFEEHTHDIIYDMKVKPDQSGNWYYDDSK